MPNPKSTLQIAGHPIHPMLIPFPIAFFVGAFVCDLAFWGTGNSMWATGALWLIGAGLIMAALAAVAGLTDFLGDQRIRDLCDVVVARRRQCRCRARRARQLVHALLARNRSGPAHRPRSVADR